MAVKNERDSGIEIDLRTNAIQLVDRHLRKMAGYREQFNYNFLNNMHERIDHELEFCEEIGLLSEEEVKNKQDIVFKIMESPTYKPEGDGD